MFTNDDNRMADVCSNIWCSPQYVFTTAWNKKLNFVTII